MYNAIGMIFVNKKDISRRTKMTVYRTIYSLALTYVALKMKGLDKIRNEEMIKILMQEEQKDN